MGEIREACELIWKGTCKEKRGGGKEREEWRVPHKRQGRREGGRQARNGDEEGGRELESR